MNKKTKINIIIVAILVLLVVSVLMIISASLVNFIIQEMNQYLIIMTILLL